MFALNVYASWWAASWWASSGWGVAGLWHPAARVRNSCFSSSLKTLTVLNGSCSHSFLNVHTVFSQLRLVVTACSFVLSSGLIPWPTHSVRAVRCASSRWQ
uniref:Putative secreted protein n=1 Tax=Ixodes ricinus TaxID=34613 RepID=A0A6B0UEV6_IXORI